MAKSFKTPSSELIDIAVNHFAIQWAQEHVSSSTKPIDTIRQEKQQPGRGHGGHGHTQPSYPECGHCTRHHQPGRSHCPARDSKCLKCHKIGHWQPNAEEEDHRPRQMTHREVSVEPNVGHFHPEDNLDTTKGLMLLMSELTTLLRMKSQCMG